MICTFSSSLQSLLPYWKQRTCYNSTEWPLYTSAHHPPPPHHHHHRHHHHHHQRHHHHHHHNYHQVTYSIHKVAHEEVVPDLAIRERHICKAKSRNTAIKERPGKSQQTIFIYAAKPSSHTWISLEEMACSCGDRGWDMRTGYTPLVASPWFKDF